MTRTRDQRRLLELFDRLLDVPPDDREAWIGKHAGDDAGLKARLEALLAAHRVESSPLDRSPVPPAAIGESAQNGEELRSLLAEALGDRYEIEDELGRGGMAIVYRARERKHDRTVVLKVLRPELRPFLGDDRFEREVRIASKMSHPNIVGLIDSGTAGGLPFFVMPYVEGETLRARLDREGPLAIETARTLLNDIAAGLDHAHRLGIIHRDLKPENILLTGEHAYILDFGIARPFDDAGDRDALTRPGLALGTPRYMSPEQREGRTVDFRTDLYAWGLIAREATVPEPPPPWADVVEACLRTEPADRPSDFRLLMRALERDDPGPWKLGPLAERAWPWTAAAVALALLAWGAVSRAGDAPPEPSEPAATAITALATPFAVAPFRNETGDPSMDMLGRLAADWIVQGLQEADVGPVVPWSASRAAAEDLAATGGPPDSVPSDLAETLSAGTVIDGAMYAIGDRLSFAARVTDARTRRVISAPAPISASPDSAERAIRELRDRILGSLAIERDPLLARIPGLSGNPPVLEAYRAYERGLELFEAQEYGEAQGEYERAFALDTSFLVPKLAAAIAMYNQSLWEQVDSTLAYLDVRRDRLTEYHDLRRRSMAAQRQGDGERAYRLELRRADLGPTPLGSYNAAHLANDLNRPDEALRLLLALDPNAPGIRGWAQYWTQLAHAYHGLERYDDELEAAREMWARFPERRIATVLAARALAAAGRHTELDSLVASLRLLPSDTYWSLGAALVVAGEETRAHRADGAAAATYLDEGISWLEARLDVNPDDRSHRYWLASARYDLEDFAEAERLFAALWADYPDRTDYRTGALVARAHLDGPESVRTRLSEEAAPIHGHELATLARLWAAGGDADRALSLLTEGLRRGISGRPWLHATSLPDLGRFAMDPRYVGALGRVLPPTPYP
jgi:tRNA A-37 threonylcarbamoyl transferase component Bud32/tetratricopeptide (TPR) repeat protein/TolB-like protein